MNKSASILTTNYITNNLIGRTGNLMFQIAYGYTKALEHNRQYVAPLHQVYSNELTKTLFRKVDFYIAHTTHLFGVENIFTPFKSPHFAPALDIPTVYHGYFQSEKFFRKNKQAIRDLYSPTVDFLHRVLIDFPFLKSDTVAAINIRRGDYTLQSSRHPIVSIEYIEEAYKLLPKHDKLLIVSDDIEWCKQNINFPNVIFNEKYWDQDALWLLSMCDHFIISNSTFSWWGAWLSNNKNKTVIAPDTWFGPDLPEDPSDIWCEDWIKLPTYYRDGQILPIM